MKKAIVAGLIAGSLWSMGQPTDTSAAETTLRYAHFMPAGSWQNQVIFEDWARSVEQASGGELEVKVFPAQTLGKAPAGYDNAKNGIAEIAWTVQGYTANRFPLSQIVELPGLFKTAEEGSCAFQKLYDSGVLDSEYEDTKVLYVHVHGPGHLHTRDKAVTSLDDLKGLKIRRPTTVIGKLLEELGAEPVGMPAPGIYEATQRGTIDGFMLPWEAVKGFRVDEVAPNHTEIGLYSLAFVATMNKAAYDRLGAAGKAAIDANSGMKWAVIAGRGYDQGDIVGREAAAASGTIYQLSDAQTAAWEEAGQRVTESYLTELEAQGLPARQTYADFKGYVADCRAMIAN
ncbi:TRAP transporter substrate-binding protein [Limibacillus halophilus]|uniref:TRAP-type C4-dicarboxylate transport system substrate-binding protein n=1 Tax=Limibacillus halophilus TaxID=1579333 RepID=A0A839SUW2_9PROT|nr:TRAP transporter substrate-binding protein [Limibacillus halophilus]MBB3066597.1 TRAP-type C4-dicarboxylate transport system substrate-binding protein [Limibacillus halophilus]